LATDTDLEIQANGKYFTSSYLLDMREHTFAVRMVSGKVATLAIDPGPLDVPYQFLVRASGGRGLLPRLLPRLMAAPARQRRPGLRKRPLGPDGPAVARAREKIRSRTAAAA
jgi:hypothetical protein